jgi:hypothetical protein
LKVKQTAIKMKGKRTGVSSEKYGELNKKVDFKPRNIPKTNEQKFKIKARLTQSILFNHLETDELNIIVQAMQEKVYEYINYNLDLGKM